MPTAAKDYFEAQKGKKVYFLGAGVSHRQLIEMFAQAGARVTLCDRRTEDEFQPGYIPRLQQLGVSLQLGAGYLDGLRRADTVFRSPGIDYTKDEIQSAVEAGVKVTSEMETFFDLCPCRTVGVTGSDGKTTTTTLIAKMLERGGFKVHLGGNIGDPLLPRIFDVSPEDLAVVELSSFQLISMKRSPNLAVVTNLTPNHLDHHRDLAEYYGAKKNILLHQRPEDTAVLFDQQTVLSEMEPCVRGRLLMFGDSPVEEGAFFDEKYLYLSRGGSANPVMSLEDIKLIGRHNRFNAAAALAAASCLVDSGCAKQVLSEFTGVEHRIEPCGEINGARFYNDSIATSPTRTMAGLRAFDQRVILIAGGYDKNLSYQPMGELMAQRVKLLVSMGPTGPKIEKALREAPGFDPALTGIVRAEGMEQAVEKAAAAAQPGDVVLMSPASASFDSYANFEQRGLHFKSIVAAAMEAKK